jgi:2-methylcitrate dehydratase PrpD
LTEPDRSNAPAYLRALAEFAATTRIDDLPARALERTRWVIADCLPVIAAGMQTDEMRAFVAGHMAHAAAGNAWIIGARRRGAALDAALLNGTAGTWLELDEGSTHAKGHPGIQIVPAALAVAQERRLPGGALLTAVALGYEISSRINRAARVREIVHPHGTFGVIGAAVAIGRMLDFTPAQMLTLLNVAAAMPMASSYRTLADGATVRNIYTGHSGYMGQIAVRLVQSGFSGERDGVATTFGEILGEQLDRDAALAGLGREWMVADGYFKLHPTARSIQSAIDALEDLMAKAPPGGIDAARISRITVDTYRLAAAKAQKIVNNSFGAKFSIPFAVATILHHGRSSLDAFGDAAVANPAIRALALRVEVTENAAYTAAYPQQQICDLEVFRDDGITFQGRCTTTKGEPDNPVREDELLRKFYELGEPVWGRALAGRLCATFCKLDEARDMGVIADEFLL